jgi:hypothetical protein
MPVAQSPPHPRRGTQAPILGTPPRAAGSIRRTSTIDTWRPDGVDGPVHLRARARDLATGADGAPEVLGEAALDVVATDDLVVTLLSTPAVPSLDALLGTSLRRGFRARAAAAAPHEFAGRTLTGLLLDDLVGAFLVNGYGGTRMPGYEPPDIGTAMARQQDICAGWRAGGTIMVEIDRGRPPPDVAGPPAQDLTRPDDPWSWHELGPLAAHHMRRARRIDVLPGRPAPVDAYFRDSHVNHDGFHSSIHEYSVHAHVQDGLFTDIEAIPHALPWVECPSAIRSAPALAGTPVADLRARVRADFVGVGTCTHLNDMLRSLEDLHVLVDLRA